MHEIGNCNTSLTYLIDLIVFGLCFEVSEKQCDHTDRNGLFPVKLAKSYKGPAQSKQHACQTQHIDHIQDVESTVYKCLALQIS